MAQTTNLPTASASGTFTLGGDLPVHQLGFGAMRITGPGVWGQPPDREEAKRVLRRAIELDINLIDTADSYGPEVSERLIAETLYPYPDGLVIATIVSVQNRFNLFDRSSEGVLDVCTQDNLGFLPWNPLAITQFTVGTEEIAAIARAHSATLAQLELAWLLQRSPVMLPIPGTSTVTHLEENVAAVQIKLSRSEFLILENANV